VLGEQFVFCAFGRIFDFLVGTVPIPNVETQFQVKWLSTVAFFLANLPHAWIWFVKSTFSARTDNGMERSIDLGRQPIHDSLGTSGHLSRMRSPNSSVVAKE
jgi:hypothetical protein